MKFSEIPASAAMPDGAKIVATEDGAVGLADPALLNADVEDGALRAAVPGLEAAARVAMEWGEGRTSSERMYVHRELGSEVFPPVDCSALTDCSSMFYGCMDVRKVCMDVGRVRKAFSVFYYSRGNADGVGRNDDERCPDALEELWLDNFGRLGHGAEFGGADGKVDQEMVDSGRTEIYFSHTWFRRRLGTTPEGRASLLWTLRDASYDRVGAGLPNIVLALSAATYDALTDAERAAIAAKGYTLIRKS